MKITTWNVRGLCSRFRMHEVWRIVLSEQWDVLCAVEHKDHRNAGLHIMLCWQCSWGVFWDCNVYKR